MLSCCGRTPPWSSPFGCGWLCSTWTTATIVLKQTLAVNRILSAPVVATSETTGTGTPRISVTSEDITDVLGFVDLRDVLASFLRGVS